jgi:DegV family protein with EDD domain
MANSVALVTDSTCDIPLEWREKFDIAVVPSTIIFGEDQYLDGVELSADQFYEKLEKENCHPSTSQPSPALFLKAFKNAIAKGAKQILTIVVAKAMSGTFTAAQQAAKDVDVPVHVMDSRSNSMGMGWQLVAAAREQEKGGDLSAMIKAAERVRDRIVYFVSLNTIEFLAKGGRIGDAIRFVESVLSIKPLVYVKREDGTVGVSMPARSRKLALAGLQREFFKRINSQDPMHITVLHNNALEEAKELARKITETYNPKEIFISIASPILGVHTGPKAVALCGYAESW